MAPNRAAGSFYVGQQNRRRAEQAQQVEGNAGDGGEAVGPTRFFYVVALLGFGMVPVMYALELQAAARRIGDRPERVRGTLPAWAGVDRSVRTA